MIHSGGIHAEALARFARGERYYDANIDMHPTVRIDPIVTRRAEFLALTTGVNGDTLPQAGTGNNNPRVTEPFSPVLLALDVHVRSGCRSAAIDAGDPAADWSNEPKPNGERLNLGAYGNTSEAARSPGGLVLFVQ